MADDDQFTLSSGYEPSTADSSDESSSAEPEQAPAPRAQEVPPPRAQPATAQDKANQHYIDELNRNYQKAITREQAMAGQLGSALKGVMDLQNAPVPKAPVPTALPAPPTDQQRGGVSEFVFNLLKFGALVAVAYGTRGRGPGHNAIWKGAIGAALQGYAAGRKDVADRSMQLWEKNRQIINDANREQNAQYREILADRRLQLQQKMDLLNSLSKVYGDYRLGDASERQDLKAAQDAMVAQAKLQRDKEQWEFKNRDTIYTVLGKTGLTAQYLAWVNQMSGGRAHLTQNSSPDELYKVEKEHPEWSYSEFLKFHEEDQKRQAAEKAEGEARARTRGTYEEKKREEKVEKEEEERIQPGGTKSDPLTLGIGP